MKKALVAAKSSSTISVPHLRDYKIRYGILIKVQIVWSCGVNFILIITESLSSSSPPSEDSRKMIPR